jgi:hypothetical protein
MFGHLKAADFVNLMDGGDIPAKPRAHLEGCPQCRKTWQSMRSAHAGISSMETEIPEPDWAQFRSSVRDQLLSRSIQRQSAVRRWTGWAIRPATAWALSMLLVIGITTVTVLWKANGLTPPPASTFEPAVPDGSAEASIDGAPDRTLFDDLIQLGEEEQDQLRQMLESLESEEKGSSYR